MAKRKRQEKPKVSSHSVELPNKQQKLNDGARSPSTKSKTSNGTSRPTGISTTKASKPQPRSHDVEIGTTPGTLSATLQLITGSYERSLHGITAEIELSSTAPSAIFSDTFLFNAHASAVRSLALSPLPGPEDLNQGVYLATGGSDERVNVYSLSAAPVPNADSKGRKLPSIPSLGPNQISENPLNRELGTLVQHSATVTSLHFPSRSKLLSGSEDNTIAITRVRDLEVVSTVKAPRPKVSGQASGDSAAAGTTPTGVNDFAVHPSMKLMLSVGRGEKCMRLWNLVTGKKAGVLNFERSMLQAVKESKYSHGEGRRVRWNKSGEEFAISFENGVVIFGEDAKMKCIALPEPTTKVHQISYIDGKDSKQYLAMSTENGKIILFDTTSTKQSGEDVPKATANAEISWSAIGGTGRIKDFKFLDLSAEGYKGYCVVAACSDGAIHLWSVSREELETAAGTSIGKHVATYKTGARITCLEAFVMLPPHDVEGGLSEYESGTGESDDSD